MSEFYSLEQLKIVSTLKNFFSLPFTARPFQKKLAQ